MFFCDRMIGISTILSFESYMMESLWILSEILLLKFEFLSLYLYFSLSFLSPLFNVSPNNFLFLILNSNVIILRFLLLTAAIFFLLFPIWFTSMEMKHFQWPPYSFRWYLLSVWFYSYFCPGFSTRRGNNIVYIFILKARSWS